MICIIIMMIISRNYYKYYDETLKCESINVESLYINFTLIIGKISKHLISEATI
jgi:hypothetical protein